MPNRSGTAPADIQGFLLVHKGNSAQALRDIKAWTEEKMKAKK